MAKRKQQTFIKGSATHRRTEGDYMSALLETVTLEDWQEVVSSALAAAKQGDAQARAWLAQYLVGKPVGKAPTPLTVVVQQLNGDNPLINRLANPVIDQYKYPDSHRNDAWEAQIKALVAAELAQKIPDLETTQKPDSARVTANFDSEQNG
ncbi:hypothetical protein [Methylomicrobium sp. Wu6]|uniref:hypothetical protein n=1 Tax=Methylomicrobium sp. Wu6 TaxID=3107928 RepID=UPI002DD622E0|nr:hypothetical protein [Methylomicrobium sp. Wu6]MEC4747457.1 hypothetical protein [Methylomicrobium sp. Wu6]